MIGQPEDADLVVGFGHVVQRARLSAQRGLDGAFLRGQAGQGRAADPDRPPPPSRRLWPGTPGMYTCTGSDVECDRSV